MCLFVTPFHPDCVSGVYDSAAVPSLRVLLVSKKLRDVSIHCTIAAMALTGGSLAVRLEMDAIDFFGLC